MNIYLNANTLLLCVCSSGKNDINQSKKYSDIAKVQLFYDFFQDPIGIKSVSSNAVPLADMRGT